MVRTIVSTILITYIKNPDSIFPFSVAHPPLVEGRGRGGGV